MKAITILRSRILAPIILVSALAAPAFGDGGLFESPIDRANREASARQWAGARAQLREQILAFNQQIAEARARFWESYPDKPGAAQAAQQFANLLREKDAYSLAVVLSGGMLDLGGVGVRMDEGIRQSAGPEFEALVAAARQRVGGSDMMGWMRSIMGALDANPKEYHEYVLQRDWWEFDHVHRIPAGFEKPETYGLYLYHRFAKLPEEGAVASFSKMQDVLGKQLVYDAAQKVMEAPKTDHGILVVTAPRPVKIAPGGSEVDDDAVPMPEGVIGVYSNPLVAMEILATQGDDRRYLIYLLKGQYHRENLRLLDVTNKWAFAAAVYDRLKIAFGEQELRQAAHVVRVAKKRMTSGDVMDPKAIGSTRIDPFAAFEDVLARKSPQGYVRSALIFNKKLESAAAVDAAYKTLISTSNENALLDTARKMAADRPNLVYRDELKSLNEAMNSPPAPQKIAETLVDYPEYVVWKGFAAGAKVNYAERMWMPGRIGNRLMPGPVTYRHAYLLQSIDDQLAKFWFTEINYNRAGAALPAHDTEIAYPAKIAQPAAPAPPVSSSAQTSAIPRAKGGAGSRAPQATGARMQITTTAAASLVPGGYHPYLITPASGPTESGQETFEINGKRIATRWQSVTYSFDPSSPDKDCSLTVKVWTSDQVPGGLVRKTEDTICPPDIRQHPYPRIVKETYVESFEGSKPGVAVPDSNGPATTAYVPPAVASRGGAASEVASPPQAVTPAPNRPAAQTAVPPRIVPEPARQRPTTSPAASPQIQLARRYTSVMVRASQARVALLRRAQNGGGELPAEVSDARGRLDPQIKEIIVAMQQRDTVQEEQALNSAEQSLDVIEKYLKQ